MRIVVRVCAMARGRSNGDRRRTRVTPEQEQAARDTRLAVLRFQDTAYRNLRNAIANVAIFFGFFGVFAITAGAADGARLWPNLVNVVAGLLGVGYYVSRSRPRTSLCLLLASAAVVIIGVVSLILVVYVVEQ